MLGAHVNRFILTAGKTHCQLRKTVPAAGFCPQKPEAGTKIQTNATTKLAETVLGRYN
jgi:hypothetical protein